VSRLRDALDRTSTRRCCTRCAAPAMSSRLAERLRATFGLHLAAWYAGLFVLGALGIFGLSYVLLAARSSSATASGADEAHRLRLRVRDERSGRALAHPRREERSAPTWTSSSARSTAPARRRSSACPDAGRLRPGRPVTVLRGNLCLGADAVRPGRRRPRARLAPASGRRGPPVGRSTQQRREVLQRFRDLLGVVLGRPSSWRSRAGASHATGPAAAARPRAHAGRHRAHGTARARVPSREGGTRSTPSCGS